jgi:hypothetical protein
MIEDAGGALASSASEEIVTGGITMRAFVLGTAMLFGTVTFASDAEAAADACKVCSDQQRACMKNYAGPTCKTEFQMCMKSCKAPKK